MPKPVRRDEVPRNQLKPFTPDTFALYASPLWLPLMEKLDPDYYFHLQGEMMNKGYSDPDLWTEKGSKYVGFVDYDAQPYHEMPRGNEWLYSSGKDTAPPYYTEYSPHTMDWRKSNLDWERMPGDYRHDMGRVFEGSKTLGPEPKIPPLGTASPIVKKDRYGMPFMEPPFADEAVPGIDYLSWAVNSGLAEVTGPNGHVSLAPEVLRGLLLAASSDGGHK